MSDDMTARNCFLCKGTYTLNQGYCKGRGKNRTKKTKTTTQKNNRKPQHHTNILPCGESDILIFPVPVESLFVMFGRKSERTFLHKTLRKLPLILLLLDGNSRGSQTPALSWEQCHLLVPPSRWDISSSWGRQTLAPRTACALCLFLSSGYKAPQLFYFLVLYLEIDKAQWNISSIS